MTSPIYYIAALHPNKRGGFGVSFPDFPGCVTVGDSLNQAIANATEALAFHVEGLRQDGIVIPNPAKDLPKYLEKTTRAITDGTVDHSIPWAIMLFPSPGKTVRIQVTMDSRLLSRIDAVTNNRSGFLADAAAERLGNNN